MAPFSMHIGIVGADAPTKSTAEEGSTMITTKGLSSATSQHDEMVNSLSGGTPAQGWYVSPREQIEMVYALLSENDYWGMPHAHPVIPPVPSLVKKEPTEELLLTVILPPAGNAGMFQRTFGLWRPQVKPTWGASRSRTKIDARHLSLVKGVDMRPGIRWVVFDPAAYRGRAPSWCVENPPTGGLSLTSVEPLMAAAMSPKWLADEKAGQVYLSGLQTNIQHSGWDVPVLKRGRVLDLQYAGLSSRRGTNPTVREC